MAYQPYRKRKGQILIETWHGSIGIKKLSADVVKDRKWVRKVTREGKETDYCIANSAFERDKVYRDNYWHDAEIWMYGHARNDILCEGRTERVKHIRKKIERLCGLDCDTKICLYAPTFRENGDIRPYAIDYSGLSEALKEEFGGSWVILTRVHFRIFSQTSSADMRSYRILDECKKSESNMSGAGATVIDVSNYPDIQELAVCTDVAITDYSSWICEYMLTRRPGFLYAPDLKIYQESDRSFAIPLHDLPFSVAESQAQLFDNIRSFIEDAYLKKCDAFLRQKGSVDDGHAAERIVNKIEEMMGKQ